jgi:hypothetical protein
LLLLCVNVVVAGAGVGQPEGSSTKVPSHVASAATHVPSSQNLHCRDGCKPKSVHCSHNVNDEHGAPGSGVGAGVGIGVGGFGVGGAVAEKEIGKCIAIERGADTDLLV